MIKTYSFSAVRKNKDGSVCMAQGSTAATNIFFALAQAADCYKAGEGWELVEIRESCWCMDCAARNRKVDGLGTLV